MHRRVLMALGSAFFVLTAIERVNVPLQAQSTAQADFFLQNVRPVLVESCFGCHDSTAMGGLRLDTKEGLLKGGKSGPAIVAGDPDKSLLIEAVRQTGAIKMPMGGERLSDAKIAALTTWIKDGAVWPDTQTGTKPESVVTEHVESRIRPVLAQQCFACHTNTKAGGLGLGSREGILAGRHSGPAVAPGGTQKSTA